MILLPGTFAACRKGLCSSGFLQTIEPQSDERRKYRDEYLKKDSFLLIKFSTFRFLNLCNPEIR